MLFVPMTARANFCMRYASSFVPFDEAINAISSDPSSCLISESLVATKPRASSQVASRNVSPSLISGLLSRSSLFTKSHPNLPFTQVATPLAGPSDGSPSEYGDLLSKFRSYNQRHSRCKPSWYGRCDLFALRLPLLRPSK